jgi:DHA1 family bicyclomycin/chloramphenicol resistance-like MFS transporter
MAQAVIATGMVLSRAIVRDMVSDAEAASMIGYVTMGMSLVPMIGPVIGGILDEIWGWQASFGFLLISGLLVTILCWRDLGETSTPSGIGLVAQVAQYPRLLASQRFWGYSLSAALASGCFFAYLGGAPFVGTQIFGLTSSQIGALFALTAVGYAAGNFLAGRHSVRLGINRMVLIGTMVTTTACLLLVLVSLSGFMGPFWFFGLTLFMGLGNGICLPNANAGILSVRPELAGTASGLGGAIMIGGGAALAALAGALLTPGATELPLVVLMFLSSVGSVLAILWVIRRARQLGLAG